MGPWRVVPTRKPHPTPSAPWRATLRQRHAIANKPATHTGTVPTCSRGLIPDAPAPAQTRVARCGTQLLPLRGQPRRPEPPAPPPAPRALRTRRRHVCSGKNKSRLPHTTQPASRGAVARPHTPTPFSRTFVATVQGQRTCGEEAEPPLPVNHKDGPCRGACLSPRGPGGPGLGCQPGWREGGLSCARPGQRDEEDATQAVSAPRPPPRCQAPGAPPGHRRCRAWPGRHPAANCRPSPPARERQIPCHLA